MQRTVYPITLSIGNQELELGDRPLLMGIVNVTPDSFSDGGEFLDANKAVDHALNLVAEGADWLDIGGESTRPGATPVTLREEIRRVIPVIQRLAEKTDVPISIDTYKPDVGREALQAGASILNDVTGFRDPGMMALAAETHATCIVMHMRGTPANMMEQTDYTDVVEELKEYFAQKRAALVQAGVDDARIVFDPGIGFAKRRPHNLAILHRLSELCQLGRPLLLGASRKRIIGEITGREGSARLFGTVSSSVLAYLQGVHILRVHDVGAMADALRVASAIVDGGDQQDG